MVEYHESLIQADQWLEEIFKLRINCFLKFLIPSFKSENSTSEAGKASRSAVFSFSCSVCLQTYLVNWIVHFVLQDGLCTSGTEGRWHILFFVSKSSAAEFRGSLENKWRTGRENISARLFPASERNYRLTAWFGLSQTLQRIHFLSHIPDSSKKKKKNERKKTSKPVAFPLFLDIQHRNQWCIQTQSAMHFRGSFKVLRLPLCEWIAGWVITCDLASEWEIKPREGRNVSLERPTW